MTKAAYSEIAAAAADAFNKVVDGHLIAKMKLPELASGVSIASETASNTSLPTKAPGQDIFLG